MISVIIPVRNGAATLPDQLAALEKQTFRGEWEVIVSDNGSTDGTAASARLFVDRLPNLRVLDASERLGAAHGRNVGAEAANGEFLAFCDADDRVTPGWLAAMVEALRAFDLVGGPLERDALNARAAGRGHPDRLSVGLLFMPYAAGSNFGIHRNVLEKLGGWDDATSLHGNEDRELCWRAQVEGYRLGFAPDAVVSYRHRPTALSLFRQFFRWGQGHPLLYLRFRDAGLRRTTLVHAVRAWAWFLVHIPDLFSAERRDLWIRKAGTRLGRIVGSVRYRVVFL